MHYYYDRYCEGWRPFMPLPWGRGEQNNVWNPSRCFSLIILANIFIGSSQIWANKFKITFSLVILKTEAFGFLFFSTEYIYFNRNFVFLMQCFCVFKFIHMKVQTLLVCWKDCHTNVIYWEYIWTFYTCNTKTNADKLCLYNMSCVCF